jgi:type VI secretion system secreted protein Hcp
MAIYLEYEGIKGNVTAEGFKDHVLVDSVSFGVSRGLTMVAGSMSNREVGKPNVSEVSLTKKADNSVTALFKEAVSGSAGKKVKLKFVRTGSTKVEQFMEYTLHDCLVSSYHISADGDQEPTENVTLSFSKCEINYTDYDGKNKGGSPQRTGYDLTSAKAL